MNNNETVWSTCCIYYKGFPDKLLNHNILPVIQTIFQRKWAKQYFFIRYFDKKGQHIRLRFKGEPEHMKKRIKPLLRKTFPSCRFIPYLPELNRYGGKTGMLLAQELFEASSNVILSFLAENQKPNYEHSLGFSLQLNVSMVHALEMQKKEAIAFFDHTSVHNDPRNYEKNAAKDAALFPFLSHLWFELDKHRIFDKYWFTVWLKEVTKFQKKLQEAYEDRKLNPIDPKQKHQQHPLWYFYESYIHMNNNRLGITTTDESYIAYIIKCALEYER